MKCINKNSIIIVCLSLLLSLCFCSCGKESVKLPSANTNYEVDTIQKNYNSKQAYFSEDLCVTEGINFGLDKTDSQVASAAGVFNVTTQENLYCQNIFDKVYPASTTKILTAYIILRDCDLSDMVTVSESINSLDKDSSVCNIKPGDVISVNDLLYGLLLNSGNDAAVVLAEYHSHSMDSFAEEMNKVALEFGATNSHFVNSHGLEDDQQYVTLYDMYLIFNQAIQNEKFVEIISTLTYTANFKNSSGGDVSQTWTNTNRYLTGKATAPNGITVVGGKSGTTFQAGYCLVLLSKNDNGDNIISIVYRADGAWNLYLLMNQILAFAN